MEWWVRGFNPPLRLVRPVVSFGHSQVIRPYPTSGTRQMALTWTESDHRLKLTLPRGFSHQLLQVKNTPCVPAGLQKTVQSSSVWSHTAGIAFLEPYEMIFRSRRQAFAEPS
jgi:hypothetical protein